MAQFVVARTNQDWTFGDPFERLPWDGIALTGNISHGLLASRQVMLRPSLPRRKEAVSGNHSR